MTDTPILFLIFNRPDSTKQVFESIRRQKPSRLFVAADGARRDRPREQELCSMTRKEVTDNIDWDCDVKFLFRDENLGCGRAVSEAISWFFGQVEMGIILEDDCLPDDSFYAFCLDLLIRYKDENKIGMIAGATFQNGIKRGNADYFFSNFNHIWGWACWADRWNKYDLKLGSIPDFESVRPISMTGKETVYWTKIFNKMKAMDIDTWDYQWLFTLWHNKYLTAFPQKNLISNIGFGAGATHTTIENEFADAERFEMKISSHPAEVAADVEADRFTLQNTVRNSRLFERVKRRLKSYF